MSKRKGDFVDENKPSSPKRIKKIIIDDDTSSDEDIPKPPSKPPAPESTRPRIFFENCPAVENIKDLIKIGKESKFYKNIDSIMLWNILDDLRDLDEMIGMESVKETVFYQIIYYLQNMHYKNQNEEYLHTVLLGNPGCGKTSLGKIIGRLYKNMGVLSKKGIFKIAHRDDFVAEYLGQTAVKTKKLLKSCIGGVLFIDEVYSMGPGQKDNDSFSKEAIDTLCSFLSENKNNFCCIIAGYEEDVKKCFFSVNSGLERRFPWVHTIEKYSSENLSDIFRKMVEDIKWELDPEVNKTFLSSFFETNKDMFKNFGGDIECFLSKIKMCHSKRIFSLDKKLKYIINEKDIENAIVMMKKIKLKDKKSIPMYMYI